MILLHNDFALKADKNAPEVSRKYHTALPPAHTLPTCQEKVVKLEHTIFASTRAMCYSHDSIKHTDVCIYVYIDLILIV